MSKNAKYKKFKKIDHIKWSLDNADFLINRHDYLVSDVIGLLLTSEKVYKVGDKSVFTGYFKGLKPRVK